ncbi:hypothetical protein H0H93_014662 [Arthromyces matolae]|nr:hypothetical protein H0H93_014662 [Arthromyces matolae]
MPATIATTKHSEAAVNTTRSYLDARLQIRKYEDYWLVRDKAEVELNKARLYLANVQSRQGNLNNTSEIVTQLNKHLVIANKSIAAAMATLEYLEEWVGDARSLNEYELTVQRMGGHLDNKVVEVGLFQGILDTIFDDEEWN